MGLLDGRVAVITGGASGIGEGTARKFVDEGARVVIADVHEPRGQALAEELGAAVSQFVHTDVTSEAEVARAVRGAIDRWGRLDAIFNNAGFGGVGGPIEGTDVDGYARTMDVLVKGPLLGMKHAVPVMKAQGSGSIISTASVAGLTTGMGPHVYSAAKAAVIQLTRSVAREVAPFGIRVNCVCPGAIATRIFGADLSDAQRDALLVALPEVFADAQPLKHAGMPADIANAVAWLASDAAAFVTGHALVVDGGLTLHPGAYAPGLGGQLAGLREAVQRDVT
jgi:NAD(P)-dependent dehydrogenase (short-subunit alcohol dehydrogenase family)